MRKLLSRLWEDDGGFIVSTELLFVSTILVVGIIAGLANLRTAVVTEMTELGNALLALDNGYAVQTLAGTSGGSNGTTATDSPGTLSLAATNAGAAAISDTTLTGSPVVP